MRLERSGSENSSSTFDRGAAGVGGVYVVDVERRAVVDTWAYPGVGRPHGIAFSSKRLR